MEAEDSWKSSDAKLFGARLLGLARLAVKSENRARLKKYCPDIWPYSPFCVIQLLLLNKFLKTVMNAADWQHLALLGLPHGA